MEDFSDFVEDLELVDPPLIGGKYTWSRRLNSHDASRIDRFLISSDWDDIFRNVKQSLLPRLASDHSPLLLQCGQWTKKASYFKFENMWLQHAGFEEMVSQWWTSFHIHGSPDFIFAKKIQQLKMHLKEWNQNVFGRLENRKAEILKKVLWLDNEAESRDLNEGEMLLKAEIAMEMEEIARIEEISWRQKSRCLWLELGDKNTKFFHKMANLHRRSNHIESLEANGSILENEEQINNEILSCYESLYTVMDLWRPSWSQDNMAAILEEENQWLQRPFDEEEILGVIKDCNGDKAPGPDGFTMEFYKKCWNIIKFDLIGALNHFHIHERFEKKLQCILYCSNPKEGWCKGIEGLQANQLNW